MKKNFKKLFILLFAFSLIFVSKESQATKFVRKNSFLNATGATRIAEIKRFQAMHNITVTGTVDNLTNQLLYNPDYQGYDSVKNPPSTGRWIVINKTKRILTVYNGSQPELKFPVTLGSNSTPTPSTKAKITNKVVNPAWGGMGGKYTPTAANDPNNPLGERWMGLQIPGKSGYGIHGTIKPWEIGQYVSNGCIRLFNYDIETYVFPKMSVGAPVWIGSDGELANWGVHQYVDKVSNNKPTTPVTPQPQPKPEPKPIDIDIPKVEEKQYDHEELKLEDGTPGLIFPIINR